MLDEFILEYSSVFTYMMSSLSFLDIELAFLKSLKAKSSDLFIINTFSSFYESLEAIPRQSEVLPYPVSN